MKIVKEGNWKEVWSAELACSEKSCGAVLLVEEADVVATDYRPGEFHFVCPVCGGVTSIPPGSLPKRIKDKLNKTRKYYSGGWD